MLDLPGVKEFVANYQKVYPGMAIQVPGNVYYNGYMATRELLRAVERGEGLEAIPGLSFRQSGAFRHNRRRGIADLGEIRPPNRAARVLS